MEAAKQPPTWKLNVQGVNLTLQEPTILAREAIAKAGFDESKPWIIVLRVAGQPKQEIGLDFLVDLRTPGLEKIRLTPREVTNGDPSLPQRMFALLESDHAFLDGLALRWETVAEPSPQDASQIRRWLLIHNYPVPSGYTVANVTLALEIPTTYPGAQIDMFYTNPPLRLVSGREIASTQVAATIQGLAFNGWSRHRGSNNPWDPDRDNVASHLALVESALIKEAGE